MAEAKSELLNGFYSFYWGWFIFSILSLIAMVVILVCCLKSRKKSTELKQKVLLLIVSAGLLVANFTSGLMFLQYYPDHIYLQTNEPIFLEGTVLEFTIRYDSNGDPGYAAPLVVEKDTNVEIVLRINGRDLEVGQTYQFLYLPNTKFAVVMKGN